ncbi:MAG: hypothetical protein ABR577_15025 [Pyrinomonadaceae bacterium]
MPTVELRERGIYRLSDKREFIVCASGDGAGYLLYTREAWQRLGLPEYRLQVNGRILSRGVVTRWRIEDLHDTGKTIEYTAQSSHVA